MRRRRPAFLTSFAFALVLALHARGAAAQREIDVPPVPRVPPTAPAPTAPSPPPPPQPLMPLTELPRETAIETPLSRAPAMQGSAFGGYGELILTVPRG